MNEVAEAIAHDNWPRRTAPQGLDPEVRELEVGLNEVAPLLHPLALNILAWRDDEHTKLGIKVPKKRHRAKCDIGFAHPNLIGEVRYVVALQDVMHSHGAGKLAVGARLSDIAGVEVRSEERRVGKECRSRWSPYH